MSATDAAALAAFVRGNTRITCAPLCPELSLHSADEFTALWQSAGHELEALGLDTPFWAVPWAGGQAMARFLIDHPHRATNVVVLDVGCGGGIAALAAARCGASKVLANDPDPMALAAARMNAHLNAVALETVDGDLLDRAPPPGVDLVIAADLWFDRTLADRATAWLRARREEGATVLIADPWRAYLPRTGVSLLCEYDVPTSTDIERHALTRTGVWQLEQ